MSDDTPTCGKGLAGHAPLAAKIGALSAALADVLEAHTHALDASDDNGAAEREAYLSLVTRQRAIAAACSELAQEMEGYRDLPMASHDMSAFGEQNRAFRRYVATEQELMEQLRELLEHHVPMLAVPDA